MHQLSQIGPSAYVSIFASVVLPFHLLDLSQLQS